MKAHTPLRRELSPEQLKIIKSYVEEETGFANRIEKRMEELV